MLVAVVSWSVGGTNSAIFEIDANGALSFQDGSKPRMTLVEQIHMRSL